MKTKLFLALALVVTMCASCNNEDKTSTIDVSNILASYQKDSLASELTSDSCLFDKLDYPWRISVPDKVKKVGQFDDTESMYNAYAMLHSIWSEQEVWARHIFTDEEIDDINLYLDSIKSMEYDFHDEKINQETKLYHDNIIKFMINHTLVTKGQLKEDDPKYASIPNPVDSYSRLDSILAHQYFIGKTDSTTLMSLDEKIDSMIDCYSDYQQKVEKAEDSKKVEVFIQALQNAKSFDEQCAIALACCKKNKSMCGPWTIEVLRQLMESGHYSPLLYRVWIVWRSFSQVEYYGLSRDSIIPNLLYDNMRSKVYIAMLNYLSTHKDDSMCIASIAYILSHNDLIRNGSFMAGNDAAIDIMTYCPDYYE